MKDKSKLSLAEIKDELKKITDVDNKTGFLYFCQNYVKVSHPTKGFVSFADGMYKWQKNAAIEFLQHTQIIYKKQRQIAASTLSACYCLWRGMFFKSQNIAVVSLGQRESTDFLRRVKFVYFHLPKWMQMTQKEWAKTSVEFMDNDSKITALPFNDDPARGSSLSLLIVDEMAAMKDAGKLLAAAMPALSVGFQTKFSNTSLPAQLFVISTLPQNPIESEYLRLLHNAQENPDESKFFLIDIDVSDIPHYNDPAWHQQMKELLGPRHYQIEILALEVYDVENSLLGASVLERLRPANPIRVDFLKPDDVDEEGYIKDFNKMLIVQDEFDPQHNYIKGFWVWEDPIPCEEYISVCDVAGGRSGDSSTVEVFRLSDYTQVAEYKGKCNLEQFKGIIETIIMYYNSSKLSIESTGLGQGTVDYFAETLMYEGLYYHRPTKKKITPGFPMSTAVRPNAIAMFASIMSRPDALVLRSVRAINEIRAFGYNKSGRIEGIGSGDDIVMTLAQLCYLINVGFAVSDNTVQSTLVFGQLIQDIDDKKVAEDNKPKTAKYFEKYYNCSLDEESIQFLEMIEKSGSQLPFDIEAALNSMRRD